jgi:hypothetical protein
LRIGPLWESGLVENPTQEAIRQRDDRSENHSGKKPKNNGLPEGKSAATRTERWQPIGKIVPEFPVPLELRALFQSSAQSLNKSTEGLSSRKLRESLASAGVVLLLFSVVEKLV